MKHPITKGVAEGLNSKIMSIKRKAGGFRIHANSRWLDQEKGVLPQLWLRRECLDIQ